MSTLFAELKRRNVFRVGAAYLALGWIVTQVTATIGPAMNFPPSLIPIVVWIGALGFPFVLLFSWVYELTPEGLKREHEVERSASITHTTARKLDSIVIALLVAAIGLFLFDRFVPRNAALIGQSRPEGRPTNNVEPGAASNAASNADVGRASARLSSAGATLRGTNRSNANIAIATTIRPMMM